MVVGIGGWVAAATGVLGRWTGAGADDAVAALRRDARWSATEDLLDDPERALNMLGYIDAGSEDDDDE